MIMKQVDSSLINDNNNKVVSNGGKTVMNSSQVSGSTTINSTRMMSNAPNGVLNTSTGVMASNVINSGGVITVPINRVIQNNTSNAGVGVPIQQNRVLTQQQLVKLLEQQLQNQPQNGQQPQIIRLASPHQIVRLQQQPQQIVRLQQQPQQIMRLPNLQPGQIIRSAAGQIIRAAQPGQVIRFPQSQLLQQGQNIGMLQQSIPLTPQQLQQLQNIQRGQPLVISTQQPPPQTTTTTNGLQMISMANAQALLQTQQSNNQIFQKIQPTSSATSVANSVSSVPSFLNLPKLLPQQPSNPVSQATSNANNVIKLTSSISPQVNQAVNLSNTNSVLTPQNIGNNYSSNFLDNHTLQNGKATAVKTEVDAKENSLNGIDDDDDIQEVEVVRNGSSNGVNKSNGIKEEVKSESEDKEGIIDIVINNVVCSFSVSCHLDLREIAMTAKNVEYRRENGMVTLKLRNPLTTASIWSSGKITCTGSTSEPQSKVAARKVARLLQRLGCNTRFRNFRVVNVLGTCIMPFGIKITNFSLKHKNNASYEPELHPGVTYKIKEPKATLKIFSTGSITVTAPSVANVQNAIEEIYPLVQEFRKERTPEEEARRSQTQFVHFHHNATYSGKRKGPVYPNPSMKKQKVASTFDLDHSEEEDEDYLMGMINDEESDSSDDDDFVAVS